MGKTNRSLYMWPSWNEALPAGRLTVDGVRRGRAMLKGTAARARFDHLQPTKTLSLADHRKRPATICPREPENTQERDSRNHGKLQDVACRAGHKKATRETFLICSYC